MNMIKISNGRGQGDMVSFSKVPISKGLRDGGNNILLLGDQALVHALNRLEPKGVMHQKIHFRLPKSQMRLIVSKKTLRSHFNLANPRFNRLIVLQFLDFCQLLRSNFFILTAFLKMQTNKTAEFDALFRYRTYFRLILLFFDALKCLDLVQT